MQFNKVVGVDLVEFQDIGVNKILANMICWGTGYQMACVVPDKTSASVKAAFAETWITKVRSLRVPVCARSQTCACAHVANVDETTMFLCANVDETFRMGVGQIR